jgi:hypothetical protein
MREDPGPPAGAVLLLYNRLLSELNSAGEKGIKLKQTRYG